MIRVFGVRHGQDSASTALNSRITGGDTEPWLVQNGRAQAAGLGSRLGRLGLIPDVAAVSPQRRAQQTWNIASAAMNACPRVEITIDALREVNWGTWGGQPTDLLRDPDIQDAMRQDGFDFLPNPQAETYREVYSRTKEAFRTVFTIGEELQQETGQENVNCLVVTHCMPLQLQRAVEHGWTREDLRKPQNRLPYCGIVRIWPSMLDRELPQTQQHEIVHGPDELVSSS